ncbi:GNAT family N-acetyltransferase [Aliarcobacter butzleri]|uniref:GNAT family N-acetyltransferase n=1 Tax=Aliarcobacter butzleri TaxID=28197 RepID=UPI0006597B04|nr:GNAT family N-acetyltransferase [Aliarcobacter butzleri]KLE06641.1 hypothetical protein AF78_02555 [Aliarcobacter butzleri L353]MCG3712131.1 GNAT family N-acetyltransferase [Aliarcobacter butzleri]
MPCSSLQKLLSKNIIHTTIDNYSIEESIFESILKDYTGFEEWFKGIQLERRNCFAIEDEEKKLEAILIYKKEYITELHPLYKSININNILKICTFKVQKNRFGKKIGELLIHKIIKVALIDKLHAIYVTAYPKHNYLIQLLERFGFERKIEYKNEIYLCKDLTKNSLLNLPLFLYQKNIIKNFPFFNDSYKELNKFIVPIRPHYHDMIFYDYPKREQSLFDNPTSINSESNSILKAYFGKFSRDINVGDIILFYRSQDLMQITNLSIVVQVFGKAYQGIYHEASKYRTVFSKDELKNYKESKNSTLIIFMPIFYLNQKITFSDLSKLSMTDNKLQTINQIDDIQYRKIIQNEECYNCFHL